MNDTANNWNKFLNIIKTSIKDDIFNTWFAPIVPQSFDDNKLILGVPSQFFYEYIEEQFSSLMRNTINTVYGSEVQLLYSITVDHTNISKGVVTLPTNNTLPNNIQSNIFSKKSDISFDSNINPSYNFENYIEGKCNKLARCAGLDISQQPGKTIFNPMFIHGESAVGKTHLASAIGMQVLRNHPEKRVLYISANLFQIQFSDAVCKNNTNDFINFYQNIDVLIIDDIQEFIGKPKTQNTFFHIFNHLHQMNKQLIMCSDREPSKLNGIEDRLISRFKWGLTVKIEKPEYELRKAILKHKVYKDGLTISDDVIEYIARNVNSNARDLEGLLISLLAHSTLLNESIDLPLAKRAVDNIVEKENNPAPISLEKIYNTVCQYYSVQIDAMYSKSRERKLSEARQVAMYLARTHTNTSLSLIGESIGKRDHSTVLYACKTIQNQMDVDASLSNQIHELEDRIYN